MRWDEICIADFIEGRKDAFASATVVLKNKKSIFRLNTENDTNKKYHHWIILLLFYIKIILFTKKINMALPIYSLTFYYLKCLFRVPVHLTDSGEKEIQDVPLSLLLFFIF